MTLDQLARKIQGRLDGGDPHAAVCGIASIRFAKSGMVTFLSDARQVAKNLEELGKSPAIAVIAGEKAGPLPMPAIRVASPYLGLALAIEALCPEILPLMGIHPTAFVDEKAEVHPSAMIGPMVVVEAGAKIAARARIDGQAFVGKNAEIAEDVHLHPRVVVTKGCRVGARTIIQAGAVIGSDGFGYAATAEGRRKIPHVGIVEIGSDVEIGANSTIDRSTLEKTSIGDGTKIDNLVHIAHNCLIGRNCTIVAQVGLSGSTILEDNVTLAGQVGTVGHLTVGRNTTVAARGVVTQDLEAGSFVSGFPCKPHQEEKRIMAAMRRLPELVRTLQKIQKLHPEFIGKDE